MTTQFHCRNETYRKCITEFPCLNTWLFPVWGGGRGGGVGKHAQQICCSWTSSIWKYEAFGLNWKCQLKIICGMGDKQSDIKWYRKRLLILFYVFHSFSHIVMPILLSMKTILKLMLSKLHIGYGKKYHLFFKLVYNKAYNSSQ